MKVKDCMCDEVCCVKPDNKVSDVAKLMCENHIGCIPVCNTNNEIVGLVTDRDVILRSIACDKDVKETPVSDIMSCNVCCCTPDEEIKEVEKKMGELQIRRIPVVENDKVVGIITIGDLTENKGVSTQEVCDTLEHICCGSGNNAE